MLNTNVEPTPPPVASAYAQIVEADRKALIARQQQQHSNVSAPNGDMSTASTAAHADGTTLDGSNGGSTTESYIPGQVYNGWLAGLSATGEPCWLPATPENLAEYALRAQQAADAEATAASLAKKQTKASKEAAAAAAVAASAGSTSTPSSTTSPQSAKHLRTAAGKVWNDPTLEDWPESESYYQIQLGESVGGRRETFEIVAIACKLNHSLLFFFCLIVISSPLLFSFVSPQTIIEFFVAISETTSLMPF